MLRPSSFLRTVLALALCPLLACAESHSPSEEAARTKNDESEPADRDEAEPTNLAAAAADADDANANGSASDVTPRLDTEQRQGEASAEQAGRAAAESARTHWAELEAEHGSTYWYEEENCLVNFKNGWSTFVQVEDGKARVLGTRTFPRAQCERVVNRYPMPLGERTMTELFTLCEQEVLGAPSKVELESASGLLKGCFYATAPGCKDNCGAGYYLRRWGFGAAPEFHDEPISGQAASHASP